MTVASVKVQYAAPRENGMPPPSLITRWIKEAMQHGRTTHATRGVEVGVRVVGEKEMTDLNQRYRHKSGPTNVLSFEYDAPQPRVRIPFLGDIVVCAPVVHQEAIAQGKDKEAHWAHLVIHGSLHLLGFDHEEPGAAHTMEALEASILVHLGYADPYS